MKILQYTLLFSNIVKSGKTPYFAINSNQFEKRLQDFTRDELLRVGFQKDAFHVTESQVPNLSRKIFRDHVEELLKNKLIVRIKTRDNRTKFYSITPLGIIHLMKSYQFSDDMKYPHPERNLVIFVLQSFAQQNIKPYKSIIFEKEKFFNYETEILEDIAKWSAIDFRTSIIHVFTNVTITHEFIGHRWEYFLLEFFVTNGYFENNKISLANFDIKKDFVLVRELDNNTHSEPKNLYGFQEKSLLKLDDDQFHHYLANLMLCSLIYDATMLSYDLYRIRTNWKVKRRRNFTLEQFDEEMKDIPEYFLRIVFLFSKHILRLTKQQFELTSGLKDRLNKIQYLKD